MRSRPAAYVLPALRGSSAQQIRRTLEECAGYTMLEVQLSTGRNVKELTESCPWDLEPNEGPDQHDDEVPERKAAIIKVPSTIDQDEVQELLSWILDITSPEGIAEESWATLTLPPVLNKDQRLVWHQAAQALQLHSSSQGIGSSRFLTISTEPIASSATDNGSSTPVPDIKALAERSRQIWEWCQQEGGRFWDISSSEIKEMLASEAGLSSELQELVQEKECGQELLSLIRQGKEQQALTLLATSSKLAWSTEGSSGAYPLHAAIQKGQLELAKALLAINGVVHQKMGRLQPLQVAAQSGDKVQRQAMIDLLKAHGAKDYSGPPASKLSSQEVALVTAQACAAAAAAAASLPAFRGSSYESMQTDSGSDQDAAALRRRQPQREGRQGGKGLLSSPSKPASSSPQKQPRQKREQQQPQGGNAGDTEASSGGAASGLTWQQEMLLGVGSKQGRGRRRRQQEEYEVVEEVQVQQPSRQQGRQSKDQQGGRQRRQQQQQQQQQQQGGKQQGDGRSRQHQQHRQQESSGDRYASGGGDRYASGGGYYEQAESQQGQQLTWQQQEMMQQFGGGVGGGGGGGGGSSGDGAAGSAAGGRRRRPPATVASLPEDLELWEPLEGDERPRRQPQTNSWQMAQLQKHLKVPLPGRRGGRQQGDD